MPLFRSSPKSPQELVKNLEEALKVLNAAEGGGKKAEKVCGIHYFTQRWWAWQILTSCHTHFMKHASIVHTHMHTHIIHVHSNSHTYTL